MHARRHAATDTDTHDYTHTRAHTRTRYTHARARARAHTRNELTIASRASRARIACSSDACGAGARAAASPARARALTVRQTRAAPFKKSFRYYTRAFPCGRQNGGTPHRKNPRTDPPTNERAREREEQRKGEREERAVYVRTTLSRACVLSRVPSSSLRHHFFRANFGFSAGARVINHAQPHTHTCTSKLTNTFATV